jgi:hypothetical protein
MSTSKFMGRQEAHKIIETPQRLASPVIHHQGCKFTSIGTKSH